METRIYSILVVDDNPDDLYIVQEAFSACGFQCKLQTSTSAEEARQVLRNERCDLILSDFGTDADEGRSFIGSIRSLRPSLPIIVLSGNYGSKFAYECGANAFVRKPSSLQEFEAKIQGIMKFWVDVAELPSSLK